MFFVELLRHVKATHSHRRSRIHEEEEEEEKVKKSYNLTTLKLTFINDTKLNKLNGHSLEQRLRLL